MVTALACLAYLVYHDATPEATVNGMIDALNARDWKGVFSRFEGANVDQVAPAIQKMLPPGAQMPKLTIKITSLTITGDTATGPVSLGFQMGTQAPTTQEDEVHLHRTNGDWKIVDGKSLQSIFTQFGKIARDPSLMTKARDGAKRTVILSHMKQLALAMIMYTTDYDDKVSLTQASLKAKLLPYLKIDKVWLDADGKPLDVRINPALVGKKLTAVSKPDLCVMLSIGPKAKLQYFDDKTPIAFVDGHVKYLTKDAIAGIKWDLK